MAASSRKKKYQADKIEFYRKGYDQFEIRYFVKGQHVYTDVCDIYHGDTRITDTKFEITLEA